MIRSFIYDTLILRLTSGWYAEVLRRVPEGATLLDVGIGTAGALLAHDDLVKRKGLRIVGIDIDADYVAGTRQRAGRERDSATVGTYPTNAAAAHIESDCVSEIYWRLTFACTSIIWNGAGSAMCSRRAVGRNSVH